MVIGQDSCTDSCGFEFQHHILDGHFITSICCKNCNVFFEKTKIKNKEAGDGPLNIFTHFEVNEKWINIFDRSSVSIKKYFRVKTVILPGWLEEETPNQKVVSSNSSDGYWLDIFTINLL